MPDLANWVKRDIKTIGESWREFKAEISEPWNLVLLVAAATATAVMMALPILTDQ